MRMPSRSKKRRSTMITVEQLVDIALGTPEIGAVNFNVLHALLHVIVQQLNIQRCLVEFKGHDSERMEGIIMTAKPGPILKVSEYMIDLTDGKPCDPETGGPAQSAPQAARPEGRVRSALSKFESNLCQQKSEAETNGDKSGRTCDCGPAQKKKARKDDSEKGDTAREKYDKSKDEVHAAAGEKAGHAAGEEGKGDKTGEDTEPEGERDPRKLSKKERCKEKKLAKRKKKEEAEEAAAAEEAREKSEAEHSEKEKADENVCMEEGGKKKKVCPCKAAEEKAQEPCPEVKLMGTSSSYYGSDSEGGCQTIVRVEAIGERCDTWRSRPALAHESLVKLEERVALLQDAFEALEKMPTNEELMKRTSATGPCVPTPVQDMWQLYNLNKRMECCEGAIEKLASMIEDIVKETCNFREAMMVIADAVDSMECSEETCANRATPGEQSSRPNKGQVAGSIFPKQEVAAFPLVTPAPCGAFSQALFASKANQAGDTVSNATAPTADTAPAVVGNEEAEPIRPMTGLPANTESQKCSSGVIGPDFFNLTTGEKFCVLKESVEYVACQLKSFTDMIPLEQLAAKLCAIVTMQKKLDSLQKEWQEFHESFSDDGYPGTVDYIKLLRTDIEHINETIAKMLEDRRQLEITIQSINQEIQVLKTIKADKDTMEDLLAEKADASDVNRKVSHDQFDAACDDLTKGLDEALERLIAQEAMWNEAMEELQRDMENKLDKLEIMPLKEFISKKLMGLQEKLKELAQLRKDAEAAGAKSRIIRNLNCIACDNDVIMRMDNKSATQHPSLPPSRSMRPYIAYELDQVRKALKKGPACRGINQVEEMMAEVQKKNIGLPLARDVGESKASKMEHYCNRYCGGSHTITTPQQRVTRIGHFLTEFGPQAMAMFTQENMALPECKPVGAGNTSFSVSQKDVVPP